MGTKKWTKPDRPWSEYPMDTIARQSWDGGWWRKVEHGWKWCCGSTFPTPGAADEVMIMKAEIEKPPILSSDDVCDACNGRGWGVFDLNSSGKLVIQRCDTCEKFESDDEVEQAALTYLATILSI